MRGKQHRSEARNRTPSVVNSKSKSHGHVLMKGASANGRDTHNGQQPVQTSESKVVNSKYHLKSTRVVKRDSDSDSTIRRKMSEKQYGQQFQNRATRQW